MNHIPAEHLHLDILPAATRRAFLYCTQKALFSRPGWYLAGGTALALQVGHRQSVDLDFFTTRKHFVLSSVEKAIMENGMWESTLRRKDTLYGLLKGAKMSFIAYPFFCPSSHQLRCGTVRLLTPRDIASMKIVAISQRGRKRDFLDLFWYCTHQEPLGTVVERAVLQYPGQENNLPHILKSLTYFADAETDPMPHLFFQTTWRKVKAYFQREVPSIARMFLRI